MKKYKDMQMAKLILILFSLVLLIPFVYSDIDERLIHVYDFEQEPSSSDLIDQVGVNDSLTDDVIGRTVTQPINGFAWNFSRASSEVTFGKSFIKNLDNLTINVWVKGTAGSTVLNHYIFDGQKGGTGSTFIRIAGGTPQVFASTISTADASSSLPSGITPVLNQNFMLTVTYNGTRHLFYVDGVIVNSAALTGSITGVDSFFYIGADWGDDNHYDGLIDEFYIWNRSLSPTEIDELWNGGDGFFYPFVEPEINKSLSIILFNEDNVSINLDFISENTNFFPAANFTLEGVTLLDSNCNFTANNISAHFELESDNVTLDGTNEITLITKTSIITAVEDTIEFDVCRTAVQSDVQIFVNGSLHHTISGSVIPVCNAGVHSEMNVTSAFITDTSLNITIRCPSCTAVGNKKVTIVDNNETLHYERLFINHTKIMPFNSEDNLYRFDEHSHHFTQSGFNTISMKCNQTINTTILFVNDTLPEINILSIDDIPFVNNMAIESNTSTTILIDVSADVISFINLSILYANGTLIKNTSSETITLTQLDLNEDGIYNITILAKNDEGNTSTAEGFFQINDTTKPMIELISPSENNISTFINSQPINIRAMFTDVNLFRYWVNISNFGSGVFVFNDTVDIFGNIEFNYTEAIDLTNKANVTYLLKLKVCDAHTAVDIKDATGIINNASSLIFQFDDRLVNIQSIGGEELLADTTKIKDRYYFDFYYNKKTGNKQYLLSSNREIVYLPTSDYKGHFVIDNYLWLDFDQKDEVVVQDLNGTYLITVMNNGDSIRFNSIGIINCENKDVLFQLDVIPPTTLYNINFLPKNFFNNEIFNTNTTAGVLLIFFLFFILIAMIVFSEFVKIPIVTLFAGIYAFFFAMLIYVLISAILGILLIILGVFYMFRSMMFT